MQSDHKHKRHHHHPPHHHPHHHHDDSDSGPEKIMEKANILGYREKIQELQKRGVMNPKRAFKLLKQNNGSVDQAWDQFEHGKNKQHKEHDMNKVLDDNPELTKKIKESGLENQRQIAKMIHQADGDKDILEKLIKIGQLKKEVREMQMLKRQAPRDKGILVTMDSNDFKEIREMNEFRGIPDKAIIKSLHKTKSKEETIKELQEKKQMQQKMHDNMRERVKKYEDEKGQINLEKEEVKKDDPKEKAGKATEKLKLLDQEKVEVLRKLCPNDDRKVWQAWQRSKGDMDKAKAMLEETDKGSKYPKATENLKHCDQEKVKALREICPDNDRRVWQALKQSAGDLEKAKQFLQEKCKEQEKSKE